MRHQLASAADAVTDYFDPDAAPIQTETAGGFSGHARALPVKPRTALGEDTYPGHLTGAQQSIYEDFAGALRGDNCQTKVTPLQAFDTYQQLFGNTRGSLASAAGLKSQTSHDIAQLSAGRRGLHFAPFPNQEYQKLWLDAYLTHPRLPLARYERAATNLLAQYGISTLYNWTPGSPNTPDPGLITPAHNVIHHTDVMARLSMLDALHGVAQMPRELLETDGVQRIVFGNIVGRGALGVVVYGGDSHDIYIDTSMFTDRQRSGIYSNEGIMQETAAHESTHLLDLRLCGPAIYGQLGDKALHMLNHGFVYNKDMTINPASRQQKGYVSLDSDKKGTAVAVRDYGKTNGLEDVATEGEVAFYGPNAPNLYENDGTHTQNTVPIKEKFALLLTRLDRVSSRVARYFIALAHVGRDASAASRDSLQLGARLQDFYLHHQEAFLPGNPERTQVTRVIRQQRSFESTEEEAYQVLDPANGPFSVH